MIKCEFDLQGRAFATWRDVCAGSRLRKQQLAGAVAALQHNTQVAELCCETFEPAF